MRTSAAHRLSLARFARSSSATEVRQLISDLLDAAGLDRDERIELLGGAFVSEAVRPYWEAGYDAAGSHAELQVDDPELSDAVEAISPMLLCRADARELSRQAIRDLESLLRE